MRGERSVFGLFAQMLVAHFDPGFPRDGSHSRNEIVFAGLVVMAGSLHPIPSRTRSLKSPALMVLRLKAWESKSPPGLPKRFRSLLLNNLTALQRGFFYCLNCRFGFCFQSFGSHIPIVAATVPAPVTAVALNTTKAVASFADVVALSWAEKYNCRTASGTNI